MADSDSRSSKRSRFDQTEPEPKRSSRFDRRSRSPTRQSESRRSRSPVNRDRNGPLSPVSSEGKPKSGLDPAAAAGKLAIDALYRFRITDTLVAAAAARINASIQAKKGIQHVDVPPIVAVSLLSQSFEGALSLFLYRPRAQLPNQLRLQPPIQRRTMSMERCTLQMVTT